MTLFAPLCSDGPAWEEDMLYDTHRRWIFRIKFFDFVAKFTFFTQKVKVQKMAVRYFLTLNYPLSLLMVKFKIGADVFVLYSFFIVWPY